MTARSYVARVKNLLTGLHPEAAEVAQVESDPQALGALVDTWLASEAFRQKSIDFFRIIFQQDGLTEDALDDQARDGYGADNRTPVFHNAMDSFALTAWDIVANDRPFTEVLTTDTFMVTPALLSTMLLFDGRAAADDGSLRPIDYAQGRRVGMIHNQAPAQVVSNPEAGFAPAGSAQPSLFYTPCNLQTNNGADPYGTDDTSGLLISRYLWGYILGDGCGIDTLPPVFTQSDWQTWRPVRFRQMTGNQLHTPFYDLGSMRRATEVYTLSERVGFFTTISFMAKWATNASNQSRGITNQTLIGALGGTFSATDRGIALSTSTLSAEHATQSSECYACHVRLDPMRAFFRRNYTLFFGQQADRDVDPNDPNATRWSTVEAGFTYHDQGGLGKSMRDLGQLMAAHPEFAIGWAQKVCTWANSMPCDPSDPALQAAAAQFAASGFKYRQLVRALMTSPIVTGAAPTQTTVATGMPLSIARRQHFCAALRLRYGLTYDPCGLDQDFKVAANDALFQVATTVPVDSIDRGQTKPTLAMTPSLFSRAAVESICASTAAYVVEPANERVPDLRFGSFGFPPTTPPVVYDSGQPQAAAQDMVARLMGMVEGDPRRPAMVAALMAHFAEASATDGITPKDALRSVFTLACTSPAFFQMGH